MKGEPRDGRALADAAVGDGGLVAFDALVRVEVAEFVGGLEGAVVVDGRGPRDVARAGDVAAALGGLLQSRGRENLAGELFGRANVDEGKALVDRLLDVVAVRADVLEGTLGGVVLLREGRDFVGRRIVVVDPVVAAAVHQVNVLVAVVLELPVSVGGEPVGVVAVEDDRGVLGDTVRTEEVLEVLLGQHVAGRLVLQLGLPVEPDGTGGVTLVVRLGVHVHFDESVRRVVALELVEVALHPVRGDEYVLRVIGV